MVVSQAHMEIEPRDLEALKDLMAVVAPRVIVELGSWEGRSALTFLLQARQMSLSTEIICIDTWLGSAEMWLNVYPDSEWSFERLRVVEGEPHILETFWHAIKKNNLSTQTSIVRAPTLIAVPYLSRIGTQAQLVYIDADHSFGAVLADLYSVASILDENGVVAGDDFGKQPVRLAVSRFVGFRKIVLSKQGQFVILERNKQSLMQRFMERGWKVERLILLKEVPSLSRLGTRRLFRRVKELGDHVYLMARVPRLKNLLSR